MKLALDANLSLHLAHAVHALLAPDSGLAISIPERFGPGVADRDWIAALHEEGGWAVLIVFILAHGWAPEPCWQKAAGIIRWLPPRLDAFRTAQPSALFTIPYRWTPAPLRRFKAP